MLTFPFDYRKLGDFTYHVLSDPAEIRTYLMQWILPEWQRDHREAPEEHWTVTWMDWLPVMTFQLDVIRLDVIRPNPDLMSGRDFQRSLQERALEREESILRGISVEPVLVNGNGFELMDGYTRYTVLRKFAQREVYAYVGTIGAKGL